jgi:CRISPR-associated protein Cas5h
MATAFEIKGPIALFRKPYTTTSTISFPIPTPTAVAGLIASILGLQNGSSAQGASANYWEAMPGTRIAIQRLNGTAWLSETINFWNTKNPQKSPHIQVKHQFVRNPHYRIFVEGGLETRLSAQLRAGRFFFTPNLGAAYALADIFFLGDFVAEKPRPSPEYEIHSAIPLTQQIENSINYLATQGLMKDTFPFRLDAVRQVKETITLLYPAGPIHGIICGNNEDLDIFNFQGETVAWLPPW